MAKIIRLVSGAAFVTVLLFGVESLPVQAASLTSSQIQAIISLLSSFGANSATIANVQTALNGGTPAPQSSSCVNLTSDMTLGSTDATTGDDVSRLQNYLASRGYFTYEGGATGYYGILTAEAVGKYQLGLGLVGSVNDSAYGITGPQTRAAILNASCGASVPPAPTVQLTPTISSVSGMPGAITPGGTVYITGTNFDQSSYVELDGESIEPSNPTTGAAAITSTSIEFVLPPSTTAGSHTISVMDKASGEVSNAVTISVVVSTPSPLTVTAPNGGSYSPGSTIHIAWTPSTTGIQNIAFVPVNGSGGADTVWSNKVDGDPVITSGSYDYVVQQDFIPSGSYYVEIGLPDTNAFAAESNTPVTITNTPTLSFSDTAGGVDSTTIQSGGSVTLKWNSTSAADCLASAAPTNSNWNGSVPLSGTQTISDITSTQLLYLSCSNSLKNVTSSFIGNVNPAAVSPVIINPPATTMNLGGNNSISWSGGSGDVQVAVVDDRYEKVGTILGWITLSGVPNDSMTWDARNVCDAAMSVCWPLSSLSSGPYKLLAVSQDALGNYCMSAGCNNSLSSYFTIATPTPPTISSVSGMPGAITPGGTVYITGTNFDQSSYVELDGESIEPSNPTTGAAAITSTSIEFVLPPSTTAGSHTVSVMDKASGEMSNTVTIVVPTPSVTGSFSSSLTGSQMNSYYTYQIQNYRSGLVLDVEPYVNCGGSNTTSPQMDCSQYLFDLSGKATESYMNVQGDPYVKGGALYRFADGAGASLVFTGFANPSYVPPSGYIYPEPESIDYHLFLRDLNNGGATVWSGTETVYFKACLAAGTTIPMSDGSYKNIEDIKVGDSVKSIKGGKMTTSVVTNVMQREDPILTINGVLKAAPDEVVYLANGKTKAAGLIQIDDQLLGEGGRAVTVTTITRSSELAKTYDLALENGAAFFADGYLVQSLNSSSE